MKKENVAYDGNDIFKINFGLYGYEDLNFKKTKESIKKGFEKKFKVDITKALKECGLNFIRLEYYSPREYNFENDSLDLVISIQNKTKLKNAIKKIKDKIQKSLNENSSYDGYIPTTISNVDDELKNISEENYSVDTIVLSELLLDKIKFEFDIVDYFVYECFDMCDVCKNDDETKYTELYLNVDEQELQHLCEDCKEKNDDKIEYIRIGDYQIVDELEEEFKDLILHNKEFKYKPNEIDKWLIDCYNPSYDVDIIEEGVKINDVLINEVIFDKEKHEYSLIEREDQIDYLIDWISECKNSDKQLMKDDLKYLIRLKDDYIFSSISTNEYIAISDNKVEFNNICRELLKLNKEVTK